MRILTLLIEPVWNRNTFTDDSLEADVFAFNRTSMESKLTVLFCIFLALTLLIEPVWNRNRGGLSDLEEVSDF